MYDAIKIIEIANNTFVDEDEGKAFEIAAVQHLIDSVPAVYEKTAVSSVCMTNKNSIWKVSSAMQKCIRRGMDVLAVKYVQAMFNGHPSEKDPNVMQSCGWYVWRRMSIIALEDIGIADLPLCALVVMLCKKPKLRELFFKQTSWTPVDLASYLTSSLALAYKSRALCDAMVSASFLKLVSKPLPSPLIPLVNWSTYGELVEGVTAVTPVLSHQSFLKSLLFMPPMTRYMMHACSDFNVSQLHSALPFLYQEIGSLKVKMNMMQDPYMIAGVPEWSFDQHNLEGKKFLAYSLKSVVELRNWFDTREAATSHKLDRAKVLGMMLFQVESAVLDKEADSPRTLMLRARNDETEMRHVGLNEKEGEVFKKLLMTEGVMAGMRKARHVVTGTVPNE